MSEIKVSEATPPHEVAKPLSPPFEAYGNVLLYTGSDPIVWAAFTARFSRSPLTALELWNTEFAPFSVAHVEHKTYTPAEAAKVEKKMKLLNDCVCEYGDNSVMEMAWVPFVVRCTSILLAMLLTDPRFGWSPMERSSRRMKMYPVEDFSKVQLTLSRVATWEKYNAAYEQKLAQIRAEHPEYSLMRARDETCDLVRGLVPLDGETLIGFTGNARAFVDLYHNLCADRFVGLAHDHPVFAELETLKCDLARAFTRHYAPFARKIDSAHDTFVPDAARTIVFCPFDQFVPFSADPHRCLTLETHAFSTASPFTSSFSISTERANRHGSVPAFFASAFVSITISSTVAIYREFKRHRTLDCTDVHIESARDVTLSSRAFWRATGSIEALLRLTELRTAENAHVDFRTLCDSILRRLRTAYPHYNALPLVFHANFPAKPIHPDTHHSVKIVESNNNTGE